MSVDRYYLELMTDEDLERVLRTATDIAVWEAAHAVWRSRHGTNWEAEQVVGRLWS